MTRKKNALTHGANAQEVMLWGETYEDYEALRTRACEEWFPEGLTEEFEVKALIELLWLTGPLREDQHSGAARPDS